MSLDADVASEGPVFDVGPVDPRGGMQNHPDAFLVAMCDNGATRNINNGALTTTDKSWC